jgi:hypothetical protein
VRVVRSYCNLSSVSRTLATQIWKGIKDDEQVRAIIHSPKQITHLSPKNAKTKPAKISVFLYNVTELSSMRNQPQTQNPEKPRTLLYLNLHYLITPLTLNAEDDQIVLGKILQIFSEKPVLRGTELQGSLKESRDDLRVTLEALAVDDLNRLWRMLSTPYKLCVSYNVYPVQIEACVNLERKPAIKNTKFTVEKQQKKTPPQEKLEHKDLMKA